MIDFAWPWAFALLPLPYLVYSFVPPALAAEEAALWVPQLQTFAAAGQGLPGRRNRKGLLFLALVCWLLLTLAVARPQWLGPPLELPVSGRDLLLAVDLSGSMQTEDFRLEGDTVDRLTALKAVADDFIQRRSGDRLGLILFGEQAYLQTPLTFDRQSVQRLLHEAVIGLAGDKTAIGDAIGLTLKRLQASNTRQKVLILLTDGANTAGSINPLKAAELAARKGLKIYTIGIGADEMEVRRFFFSQRVNPSADLDEATLKGIAEQTGGRYFRARDTADLAEIYRMLDQIEPVQQQADIYRPVSELYVWPLGAALAGSLLYLLIGRLVPRRRRQ